MKHKNQEPDAQGVATSSVSNQVVETQELATHSVVETQEPAIAATQEPTTAETQEPTMAATEEPTTAETQEPAADTDTEIQESEVRGAAKLLSLHQEAKTQESTTIPVASPQEPASEVVTAT
jgi:hypothetical protein